MDRHSVPLYLIAKANRNALHGSACISYSSFFCRIDLLLDRVSRACYVRLSAKVARESCNPLCCSCTVGPHTFYCVN